jgi:hypothetical protein
MTGWETTSLRSWHRRSPLAGERWEAAPVDLGSLGPRPYVDDEHREMERRVRSGRESRLGTAAFQSLPHGFLRGCAWSRTRGFGERLWRVRRQVAVQDPSKACLTRKREGSDTGLQAGRRRLV